MSADPPVSLPPTQTTVADAVVDMGVANAESKAQKPRPELLEDERRRHCRAAVSMPVHVVSEAGFVQCIADNLSAGGALLSGAPELKPGTELVVALRLRGHPWHVRARVLRVERDTSGSVALAVAFPGIVPRVQDLIQSYVLSQLRAAGRSRDS